MHVAAKSGQKFACPKAVYYFLKSFLGFSIVKRKSFPENMYKFALWPTKGNVYRISEYLLNFYKSLVSGKKLLNFSTSTFLPFP